TSGYRDWSSDVCSSDLGRGGSLEQDRIGVVDMRVDAMPARKRPKPLEAAAATADRYVIHLASGAGADSQRDGLAVGPERAVEQRSEERRVGNGSGSRWP